MATSGSSSFELTVEQRSFVDVGRAMRAQADGKELRKALLKELREAGRPTIEGVKAAALSLPSSGGNREGAPLRQAIARQVRVENRLSGRDPGVSIKVKSRNMPRSFRTAARRLNRPGGWRHPTYGHAPWVQQSGRPDWFESAVHGHADDFRRAVLQAVEAMAQRVAAQIRRSS